MRYSYRKLTRGSAVPIPVFGEFAAVRTDVAIVGDVITRPLSGIAQFFCVATIDRLARSGFKGKP
jgi:hypothetical protein